MKLEEALTTLHEELKFLESQEVQSVAKDLAKKNRQLTVQIERERTRNTKLRIESEKLKSELKTYSHHHLSPRKVVQRLSFSEKPLINDDDKDNKNNNKEFEKLNEKLIFTRNEIKKYKDINNKLKNALKKETGDDKLNMLTLQQVLMI